MGPGDALVQENLFSPFGSLEIEPRFWVSCIRWWQWALGILRGLVPRPPRETKTPSWMLKPLSWSYRSSGSTSVESNNHGSCTIIYDPRLVESSGHNHGYGGPTVSSFSISYNINSRQTFWTTWLTCPPDELTATMQSRTLHCPPKICSSMDLGAQFRVGGSETGSRRPGQKCQLGCSKLAITSLGNPWGPPGNLKKPWSQQQEWGRENDGPPLKTAHVITIHTPLTKT